jgi:hypothetical protein
MRRSIMAIGVVAIVLLGSACIWLLRAAGPDAAALAAARADAEERWALRGFSSYRMVLAEGNCYADYEVRAEHVVWSYEASCGRGQPRSVTHLFDQIRDGAERGVCEGVGCPCERKTVLEARYDGELGYPTRIAVQSTLWPNWQSSTFWRMLGSHGKNPCSRSYLREILVKALIPHTQ